MVARLTGLSPHVIRVWEKRYAAVTPERGPTNRRLYSDAEVERLRLLKRATDGGHQIGIVARLTTDDLRLLLATVESRGPAGRPATPSEESSGWVDERNALVVAEGAGPHSDGIRADEWLEEALAAVEGFGLGRLRELLEAGVVGFGHNGLLHRLVYPLAREVGERWQRGTLTAAQEHFASAAIREFLLGSTRPYAGGEGAPAAVVATPAGQLHELGAVMAAAAATNAGWKTIYLGPSLPAADLAGAAIQNRVRAVLLSLVYPADDPQVATELALLRRYLPESVAIVAGGRAVSAYGEALAAIGARTLTSLEELSAVLEAVRQVRLPR